MYAHPDLAQVLRLQDEHRRTAELHRLVSRGKEPHKADRTRRILGLRLSFA